MSGEAAASLPPLEGRVAELEAEHHALRTKVKKQKKDIRGLEQRLDRSRKEVASLARELDDERAARAAAETELQHLKTCDAPSSASRSPAASSRCGSPHPRSQRRPLEAELEALVALQVQQNQEIERWMSRNPGGASLTDGDSVMRADLPAPAPVPAHIDTPALRLKRLSDALEDGVGIVARGATAVSRCLPHDVLSIDRDEDPMDIEVISHAGPWGATFPDKPQPPVVSDGVNEAADTTMPCNVPTEGEVRSHSGSQGTLDDVQTLPSLRTAHAETVGSGAASERTSRSGSGSVGTSLSTGAGAHDDLDGATARSASETVVEGRSSFGRQLSCPIPMVGCVAPGGRDGASVVPHTAQGDRRLQSHSAPVVAAPDALYGADLDARMAQSASPPRVALDVAAGPVHVVPLGLTAPPCVAEDGEVEGDAYEEGDDTSAASGYDSVDDDVRTASAETMPPPRGGGAVPGVFSPSGRSLVGSLHSAAAFLFAQVPAVGTSPHREDACASAPAAGAGTEVAPVGVDWKAKFSRAHTHLVATQRQLETVQMQNAKLAAAEAASTMLEADLHALQLKHRRALGEVALWSNAARDWEGRHDALEGQLLALEGLGEECAKELTSTKERLAASEAQAAMDGVQAHRHLAALRRRHTAEVQDLTASATGWKTQCKRLEDAAEQNSVERSALRDDVRRLEGELAASLESIADCEVQLHSLGEALQLTQRAHADDVEKFSAQRDAAAAALATAQDACRVYEQQLREEGDRKSVLAVELDAWQRRYEREAKSAASPPPSRRTRQRAKTAPRRPSAPVDPCKALVFDGTPDGGVAALTPSHAADLASSLALELQHMKAFVAEQVERADAAEREVLRLQSSDAAASPVPPSSGGARRDALAELEAVWDIVVAPHEPTRKLPCDGAVSTPQRGTVIYAQSHTHSPPVEKLSAPETLSSPGSHSEAHEDGATGLSMTVPAVPGGTVAVEHEDAELAEPVGGDRSEEVSMLTADLAPPAACEEAADDDLEYSPQSVVKALSLAESVPESMQPSDTTGDALTAQIAVLEDQLAAALSDLERERTRADVDLAALRGELQTSHATAATLQQQLLTATGDLVTSQHDLSVTHAELRAQHKDLAESRAAVDVLQRKVTTLQKQLASATRAYEVQRLQQQSVVP